MTGQQALASEVRTWVTSKYPGDIQIADRAVAVAMAAYEEGASVSEACERARSLLESWERHPSNWRRANFATARLAS